ncbi:MAG: diacylglycerol kinase family lipid kinase [Planctomycetes bacterium]|nr:diacylglycerol kinase family lipid kinase [Planctomycetota bacterium]
MNERAAAPRRVLLIANPISGGGRGRVLAGELEAALQRRGVDAETWLTRAAGCAADRARRAGPEPWHALVAIGGDGTVNEVLNGMPDPTRPLGVLPVGTANVLAMELGLPRRVEPAADALAAGHTRAAAIGTCNGRRFLLFVGCGVDGAIVRRLAEVRTGTLGKHKWLGPLLHTVRRWPRCRLRVTLADGEVLDDLSSVLVSRVRNYGGILRLLPGTSIDSGLLHVHAFRMRSRAAWLWHGLRATVGMLREGPHLLARATTGLRIEGTAPFEIDGDYGGESPVELGLLPERARLIVPR